MLIDEIKKANMMALKNHDNETRTALSMIIARYTTLLTSGKGEVGDADVVRLIQKFDKELLEEKEGYVKLGREDSALAIEKQRQAIASFLPKMLSEEEIRNIIASLEDKTIPSVMKHFKEHYNGQCDMGLVSKIARNA